ncbi:MAG: GAF domain-containing sensor histidine kinase [Bacteroidales bacterium]|jgi:signal transduction histidine kinase|nr:GAF domain-containing sensor histidine kinase [Bacteroidales bacterium]MDD4672781.1 GAF domain-containing sensor histidine kinase [Bacteroidales bacterium]MDY0347940.1 GAF domain-containing sensor histidine kinase [Tenuifilaceae bacterium]
MNKFSTVTIRETKKSKRVRISSDSKPKILDPIIGKWQTLLNTLAKAIGVPSGLIMRLNEETIEVFLKSNTESNPYKVSEKTKLIYGLYCETVIGTQNTLIVPDATKSKVWNIDNPDIDLNMISYMGVPLNWPDGECFGTICVLDNKENHYSKEFEELLIQIKQHIEVDLQLLQTNQELEKLNDTKTKFLSLISHDVRGNIGSANQLLKLIIENIDSYSKSDLKDTLNSLSQSLSESHFTLENMLSWSKAEILQIEPEILPVDLVEVIDELLQFFNQTIEIKKLRVKKDYYSNKVIVSADRKMFKVGLNNILSNAIKYSQVGGLITIRLIKKKHKTVVEIIDNGIGMDKNTANKLFNYNKSHSKSGTHGESSSGIGLMLTKEFLDKNNAVVTVDSKIGEGTKFRITI